MQSHRWRGHSAAAPARSRTMAGVRPKRARLQALQQPTAPPAPYRVSWSADRGPMVGCGDGSWGGRLEDQERRYAVEGCEMPLARPCTAQRLPVAPPFSPPTWPREPSSIFQVLPAERRPQDPEKGHDARRVYPSEAAPCCSIRPRGPPVRWAALPPPHPHTLTLAVAIAVAVAHVSPTPRATPASASARSARRTPASSSRAVIAAAAGAARCPETLRRTGHLPKSQSTLPIEAAEMASE
ncbi:hypothetical protein BU16DRAFT_190700 [Lophium mytilinum]|uniref:Uncharacterized protein n=1 Tax=Lophium mytilinum TaxID=390894 RepID=A0A6A6R8S0_9PEZI|nr:hypothetical protein BU16DRAFT_190700 [Lophium mytilinum]